MNEQRPNIILITTDQQRFDTLAAGGNSCILTPHLDWLCDQGIRFNRAYSDAPLCVPARATIMTGRSAHRNAAECDHSQSSPMAQFPTLPGLLTQAGYQTRQVGKTHFSPERARYGYEHIDLDQDFFRYLSKHPHLGDPTGHGVGQNEMSPVILQTDERHTLTRWVADKSIDFLETRDPNHPFFMHVSYSDPHPPFAVPQNYWELYRDRPVPPPVFGDWSEDFDAIPFGFREPTMVLNNVQRYARHRIDDIRRAYYASITQVDYSLGLLLARLRELDLLGNTWIVFTSDHGDMLGDHHLGAKSIFLEGAAHIPFIVRPPQYWDVYNWEGTLDPTGLGGTTSESLVCLADLMPTFLDLAGVERPVGVTLDGINFMEAARGRGEREQIFGNFKENYMHLKGDWKYHFTAFGGAEQLFNLRDDPYERIELSQRPEYAEVLTELRAEAAAHFAEFDDPAVDVDRLRATQPIPDDESAYRRDRTWPGFHTPFGPRAIMH